MISTNWHSVGFAAMRAWVTFAAVTCSACTSDADEIRAAQRAWQALHIQDYVFVYFKSCFCDFPDVAGVRVTVQGAKALEAVNINWGDAVDKQYAVTLDDLFDDAIETSDRDPDVFKVQFDRKYHFIDLLAVDSDTSAEDDGFDLKVSCFSESTEGCPVKRFGD